MLRRGRCFQQKSFDITNNQEFLMVRSPGCVSASSYPGSNEGIFKVFGQTNKTKTISDIMYTKTRLNE